MESIELSAAEPIQLDFSNDHGGGSASGFELLMNTKKTPVASKVNFSTATDMDALEKELNDIVKETTPAATPSAKSTFFNGLSDWFPGAAPAPAAPAPAAAAEPSLGQATKESVGTYQTWDGYTKLNDTFVNNEKAAAGPIKNITELEKRKRKRTMLKKLNHWQEKKNQPRFSPDLSYEEIEEEYEAALDEHQRAESIKLQAWWLKTLVHTVEYGSSFVDLDLTGFSEQVEDEIDTYDEIFEELYERYKGGKLHPVVSLCLKLGVTAATINIANRMLSAAAPGFRDIIKQSPELMKVFTSATVDAMSKQNPAFQFTNDTRGAPAPDLPPYAPRPADVTEARGFTLRETKADEQKYTKIETTRPPMQGPSVEFDKMFSALGNLPHLSNPPPADAPTATTTPPPSVIDAGDSIVSVSSLKDLQNKQLPRQSKRRNLSDKNKNIVSLDI
jgi:hypothetical protein